MRSRAAVFIEPKAQKPQTPAEALRDALHRLETQVGGMKHSTKFEALMIPVWFDEASTLLSTLRHEAAKVQAEAGRFEMVAAQFKQKGTVFLRRIGGVEALHEVRRTHNPDPDAWWWFIDDVVVAQRKARIGSLLRWGVVAGLVLLIVVLAYNMFLAPDPATRARVRHQFAAEDLIQEGDFPAALHEVNQALALAPDDPGMLVWQGVLEDVLGNADRAEEAFAAAERAFDQRSDSKSTPAFLMARAQAYLRVGHPEATKADAERLLERDPQSAEAHFYLGAVYETLGDVPSAIVYYEQASTLAQQAGEFELAATTRIRLAELLRSAPLNTPTE